MAGINAKDVKALRDQTGAGMMDCKKALTDADGDVEKAQELLRERGLAKAGKRAGRATSEGSVGFAISGGQGTMVEIGCETDFVARNEKFQSLVQKIADAIADAGAGESVEKALAAPVDGTTVEELLATNVGVIGENMELKRVTQLAVDGLVSGYIHGGGSLGVLVAIETGSPDAFAEVGRDVAMHVAAADPTPLAVSRDDIDPAVIEKERDFLTKEALASGKPENIVENMVNGRLNKFYVEHALVDQPFVKDPDKKVGAVVKEAGDGKVAAFVRFKLGEAV